MSTPAAVMKNGGMGRMDGPHPDLETPGFPTRAADRLGIAPPPKEALVELAGLMTALEDEMCARVDLHVARYELERREGEKKPDLEALEAEVRARYATRREVERGLTKEASWRRFTDDFELNDFERSVVGYLLCVLESPRLRSVFERQIHVSINWQRIGRILALLCPDAEAALLARPCFALGAPLFACGLVEPPRLSRNDAFLDEWISLRADVSAAILGDGAALTHLSPGVRIEEPTVRLDRVVLREDARVLLERMSRIVSSDDSTRLLGVSRGSGTVALFTGPPGTGKTLAAEAVATEAGRLLVSFIGSQAELDHERGKSSLSPAEQLEVALLQAHRNKAVLFIDECDRIFELDDEGRLSAPELLTVIERAQGLVIMATNKPVTLEEALDRRVLYRLEFPVPSAAEREEIWRLHLPSDFPVEEGLTHDLACRHILTGGYIRNAVQQAMQVCSVDRMKLSSEEFGMALARAAREQAERAKLFLSGYRPLEASLADHAPSLEPEDAAWVMRAARLLKGCIRHEGVRVMRQSVFGVSSSSILLVGEDAYLLGLVAEQIAWRAGLHGLAEVPISALAVHGMARAMELESTLRLVRDRGAVLLRLTATTDLVQLREALEFLSLQRVPVLVTWTTDMLEARGAAPWVLEARRLTTKSRRAGLPLLERALELAGLEAADADSMTELSREIQDGELGAFLLRLTADLATSEDEEAALMRAAEEARLPGLRSPVLFE